MSVAAISAFATDSASRNRGFFKTYLAIGAAICLTAIVQTQLQTEALVKLRTRYKWALLMAAFALNAALALVVVLRRERDRDLWGMLTISRAHSAVWRFVGICLIVLPLPTLWLARGQFFGNGLEGFFRLLWLFWWLALAQAIGLKLLAAVSWPVSLSLVLLFDGMLAELYTLALPISNYPFSIGWSEASRFYYGSLVFSPSVYGQRFPLSVWHGSRYLMLAVPFLVRDVPIWAARLWQVLLWVGVTAASSWALVRRLRLGNWLAGVIFGSWLFLYIFQGAVYYHLQVCVIIVLLGVRREHPWRSLVAVLAASFWAGMSRLNWYPVPAMLAIALYLLEQPAGEGRKVWRYLQTPALWAILGVAAALGGQAFYIAISGDTNLEAFGSSLTSALLWYRWLPSPTNPIGIIPGVIVVSLPLWLIIGWRLRDRRDRLHPVRWFGLLAMLFVLLLGGLIVSTKIGGGGDLHNMDAYLVLLAILAAYFILGKDVAETRAAGAASSSAPWPALALMVLVPVAFSILRIGSPFEYDPAKAAADLATVRREVQAYSKSGPILFMYERQLLTFHMIPGVALVPQDEVVSIMEMAISGNEPYLDQYYADLANHRFAAIVAHPQNLGVETGDFIEENDAWARLVAQPMLCQYKPALTLDYSKVQILIPRARPCTNFPPTIHAP
ncbi:MAG: hypothetical protein ACK2UU_03295 [Anaerolineae bacterium]